MTSSETAAYRLYHDDHDETTVTGATETQDVSDVMPQPTIVYLAGSGRSGSTLVERVLGQIDGFVNVGELIDLVRRVLPGDERCGCGERFSSCEFWTAVGERFSPGGWDAGEARWLLELERRVARQRYLPVHLGPWAGGASFTDDSRRYQEVYARLYQAIADVSGARVVVDASKLPAQAAALAAGPADLDLRIIHVVRDVRGVAWSLANRSVARPHATGGTEHMYTQSELTAALRWTLCQQEVPFLRRTGVPVSRLEYEQFMARPAASLITALDGVGLPVAGDALGHVRDRTAELGPSHGLSGNPGRFSAGNTDLRADDVWRREMRPVRRLALGGLARTDRLRARRRLTVRHEHTATDVERSAS